MGTLGIISIIIFTLLLGVGVTYLIKQMKK